MKSNVRSTEKYSYVIFPSEAAVFDNCGNTVIKCPTEAEAVEYIRDLVSEVDIDEI